MVNTCLLEHNLFVYIIIIRKMNSIDLISFQINDIKINGKIPTGKNTLIVTDYDYLFMYHLPDINDYLPSFFFVKIDCNTPILLRYYNFQLLTNPGLCYVFEKKKFGWSLYDETFLKGSTNYLLGR